MRKNNTNNEWLIKKINDNNEWLMKKTLYYSKYDKRALCLLGIFYVGACTLVIYGILRLEDFLQMMGPFD